MRLMPFCNTYVGGTEVGAKRFASVATHMLGAPKLAQKIASPKEKGEDDKSAFGSYASE